jgi:hypothetical protein
MAAHYFGIASGELLVESVPPLLRTPVGPLDSGARRHWCRSSEPPFRSRPPQR